MFKVISISILFLGLALSAVAQNKPSKNQKASFMVEGVCKMCKKRIETAALIPGVKLAEWNKESGVLSVIYNDKKIDDTDIHQALNKAGHDTEKSKAADEDYKKLPGCCAYRDGVKKH